jgi:hypothetical protein
MTMLRPILGPLIYAPPHHPHPLSELTLATIGPALHGDGPGDGLTGSGLGGKLSGNCRKIVGKMGVGEQCGQIRDGDCRLVYPLNVGPPFPSRIFNSPASGLAQGPNGLADKINNSADQPPISVRPVAQFFLRGSAAAPHPHTPRRERMILVSGA